MAADEQCDNGVNVNIPDLGCTRCSLTVGYVCEVTPCDATTTFSNRKIQQCATVCGDAIVVGKEECDLGYLNGDGGLCMDNCISNRGEGCIGLGCNISEANLQRFLEKPVELESMGVLKQLNSSREGTSSSREGLFFVEEYGYAGPGGRSNMEGRGTMFFGNESSGETDTFGMAFASGNSFKQVLSVGALFDCPVCVGMQADVTVPSGVMSDRIRQMTVPQSCHFRFDPVMDVKDTSRRTVVTFMFTKLHLRSQDPRP